jgi:CBS domain-containing protein
MRDSGIHRVLVMQGDALVGIVTTSDISEAVAERRTENRALPFRPSRPGHTKIS